MIADLEVEKHLNATQLDGLLAIVTGAQRVAFVPSDHWEYRDDIKAVLYPRHSLMTGAALATTGQIYQKGGYAVHSQGKADPWRSIDRAITRTRRATKIEAIAPKSAFAVLLSLEEERVENRQRDAFPALDQYSLPRRDKDYRRESYEADLRVVADMGLKGRVEPTTGLPDYWKRAAIALKLIASGAMQLSELPEDMPWDEDLRNLAVSAAQAETLDAMLPMFEKLVAAMAVARIAAADPDPVQETPQAEQQKNQQGSQSPESGSEPSTNDEQDSTPSNQSSSESQQTEDSSDDESKPDKEDVSKESTGSPNDEDGESLDKSSQGTSTNNESGESNNESNESDDEPENEDDSSSDESETGGSNSNNSDDSDRSDREQSVNGKSQNETDDDEMDDSSSSSESEPQSTDETTDDKHSFDEENNSDDMPTISSDNDGIAKSERPSSSESNEPTPKAESERTREEKRIIEQETAETAPQTPRETVDFIAGDGAPNAPSAGSLEDKIDEQPSSDKRSDRGSSATEIIGTDLSWDGVKSTVSNIINPLRRAIDQYFIDNQAGVLVKRLRRGRYDVRQRLSDKAQGITRPEVCSKRMMPGKKDIYVYILADISASMTAEVEGTAIDFRVFGANVNARWMMALRMVIALVEVLKNIEGVQYAVGVHDERYEPVKEASDPLNERTKNKMLEKIGHRGSTCARDAYVEIRKRFARSDSPTKVLIHLTDGEITSHYYGSTSSEKPVQESIKDLERDGVEIIVLTVGMKADNVRKLVGDHRADEVTDANIGNVLGRHLKRTIAI